MAALPHAVAQFRPLSGTGHQTSVRHSQYRNETRSVQAPALGRQSFAASGPQRFHHATGQLRPQLEPLAKPTFRHIDP